MPALQKVAAAHIAPVLMDVEASVRKACEWIQRAGEESVDLLVFPEVFLPGFPYWINCYPPLTHAAMTVPYQQMSLRTDGPELAAIAGAAKEADVAVVMGFSERAGDSGTCYNSLAFIERDGAMLGVRRKLQPTFAERTVWGQGDASTLFVLEMAAGRVGGLSCWEHTMYLARQALVVQNEQIHAGLWPSLSTLAGFETTADTQIEAMMRSHAIMAQCFVVCASSPVTPAMLDVMHAAMGSQELMHAGGGWSAVIHPFTPYLAGPHTGEEETLVAAEIDLDDIAGAKMFVDGAGHYSRSELLRLYIDDEAKTPITSSPPGTG